MQSCSVVMHVPHLTKDAASLQMEMVPGTEHEGETLKLGAGLVGSFSLPINTSPRSSVCFLSNCFVFEVSDATSQLNLQVCPLAR